MWAKSTTTITATNAQATTGKYGRGLRHGVYRPRQGIAYFSFLFSLFPPLYIALPRHYFSLPCEATSHSLFPEGRKGCIILRNASRRLRCVDRMKRKGQGHTTPHIDVGKRAAITRCNGTKSNQPNGTLVKKQMQKQTVTYHTIEPEGCVRSCAMTTR
ncbi:hypothetical protein F5X98DRAFT_241229 [Xylaria grammica]|nr:hypothetical protein F5X98DRAFT_241229 [Xylaria grammica]